MAAMNIDRILSELSLNEKVSLLSGPSSYLPRLPRTSTANSAFTQVPTPGTPSQSPDSASQQSGQQTVQTAYAGPASLMASPRPASHAGQHWAQHSTRT
jgi:hypothetical protein